MPAGYVYRLPTEAEWEYAARAGLDEDFSIPVELVWSRETSGCRPHEVGASQPNKWGLYDMHGNAMEWCLDAWYEYPKGMKELTIDPIQDRATQQGYIRRPRRSLVEQTGHVCQPLALKNHNNPNGFRGFRIVLGPEIQGIEN